MKKESEEFLKQLNYKEENEIREYLIGKMIMGNELIARKIFWEWFLIFTAALDVFETHYSNTLDLSTIPPIEYSGTANYKCIELLNNGIFFYFLVGLASIQNKKKAYTSTDWADEIIFRYKNNFFKYKSRFNSNGDVYVDIYKYDDYVDDKTEYADLNKLFKNEYSKVKPSQIKNDNKDRLIAAGINLGGAFILFIAILAFVLTHFS